MNDKLKKRNELLHSISFLNALIMVFFTMIYGNGGVGVLAFIMIGALFLVPQMMLYILRDKKSNSLLFLAFKIILVILGYVITFSMFNFTSDSINIFIIFNFIILTIILLNIIIEYKK